MILMGILMFSGKMNAVTGYLSGLSADQEKTEDTSVTEEETDSPEETSESEKTADPEKASETENSSEADSSGSGEADSASEEQQTNQEDSGQKDSKVIPALDFTLKDQFGNTHTLADYKGKTIFLNFWATWCGPCRAELPDIQKLYEKYSEETEEEVVVLGVAGPRMGGEKTEEEIREFLEENELTYPVLMDTDWTLFQGYGISSFPTTFMIDRDGNVFGYVAGQLSYDIMEDIIRQTKEGR